MFHTSFHYFPAVQTHSAIALNPFEYLNFFDKLIVWFAMIWKIAWTYMCNEILSIHKSIYLLI